MKLIRQLLLMAIIGPWYIRLGIWLRCRCKRVWRGSQTQPKV